VAVNITIVGCGPGSADYVTPVAREAASSADLIVGAPRLLDLFTGLTKEKLAIGGNIAEALDIIAAQAQNRSVAVLVSGDPGIFSLARRVLARFGRDSCRVIPGISSVQVAFARLGLDWADARIISSHKQDPDASIEDALRSEKKLAIFAGRDASLVWIARMAGRLDPGYGIYVCENLTLDNERIQKVSVEDLTSLSVSSSTLVLIIRDIAWE